MKNKKYFKLLGVGFAIISLGCGIVNVSAFEDRGIATDPIHKSQKKEIEDVLIWTHYATFYPDGFGTSCSVSQDITINKSYVLFQEVFKSFRTLNKGFTAEARVVTAKDYIGYEQVSTIKLN